MNALGMFVVTMAASVCVTCVNASDGSQCLGGKSGLEVHLQRCPTCVRDFDSVLSVWFEGGVETKYRGQALAAITVAPDVLLVPVPEHLTSVSGGVILRGRIGVGLDLLGGEAFLGDPGTCIQVELSLSEYVRPITDQMCTYGQFACPDFAPYCAWPPPLEGGGTQCTATCDYPGCVETPPACSEAPCSLSGPNNCALERPYCCQLSGIVGTVCTDHPLVGWECNPPQ